MTTLPAPDPGAVTPVDQQPRQGDTPLRFALVVFGSVMLLLYPIAVLWPSGWAWHHGAPHDSLYFMMIVGVYATLGLCLLNAARDPRAHTSLIWFAVWSSLVHAGIMAVQSVSHEGRLGHLWGDVPALLLVGTLLPLLLRSTRRDPRTSAPDTHV